MVSSVGFSSLTSEELAEEEVSEGLEDYSGAEELSEETSEEELSSEELSEDSSEELSELSGSETEELSEEELSEETSWGSSGISGEAQPVTRSAIIIITAIIFLKLIKTTFFTNPYIIRLLYIII